MSFILKYIQTVGYNIIVLYFQIGESQVKFFEIFTKASKKLEEEVKNELSKKDPDEKRAQAILDRAEKNDASGT